jgi:hypothetical protein
LLASAIKYFKNDAEHILDIPHKQLTSRTNTSFSNHRRCIGYLVTGSTDRYIAKGLSIPPSSSVELVTGGAKFVMQNTDVLKVESDTATSADVYVSVVDSISA